VNECSANPTVSVEKRMNCLELRVDRSSLDNRLHVATVRKMAEVLEQAGDVLRWWRDELSIAWVIRLATNPVLVLPDHAAVVLVPRASKEDHVDLDEVLGLKSSNAGGELYRFLKGSYVLQDQLGVLIPPLWCEGCLRETPMGEHEALNSGGRD